jgi:3-phosphoinositide dependent protein kinase-1
MGGILGEGSYAKVYEATLRSTNYKYAVKVVDKDFIKRHNKIATVLNERNVLNLLRGHPGIVSLYYTFQDTYSLYYVLELAKGGELYDQLQMVKHFDTDTSRFYAYELAEIIRYMHSKNVIHRDIKPANILLAESGHVKVTDFGTAKILTGNELPAPVDSPPSSLSPDEDDADFDPDALLDERNGRDRASSFVGTAEYVPPELLLSQQLTWGSDWWSFGVVLYELLTGTVPFRGASEYLTFQAILNDELAFPPHVDAHARDLISRLLHRDRARRLGLARDDADKVLSHPFFAPLHAQARALSSQPRSRSPSRAGDAPAPAPEAEAEAEEADVSADAEARLALRPSSSTSTPAPTPTASRARPQSLVFRMRAPRYKSLRADALPPGVHRAGSVPVAQQPEPTPGCCSAAPPALVRGVTTLSAPAPDQLALVASAAAPWLPFLRAGETLLCHGAVVKSGRWSHTLFSKRRQLLLTDGPRLLYVAPSRCGGRGELRGEVPLAALGVEVLDERKFLLHVPGRQYLIHAEEAPTMHASLFPAAAVAEAEAAALAEAEADDDESESVEAPVAEYVASAGAGWAAQWRHCVETVLSRAAR